MAVGFYGTFLAIQTSRHRAYFTMEEEAGEHEPRRAHALIRRATALLLAYMLPVVYLAEQMARPIDHLIEVAHAPSPWAARSLRHWWRRRKRSAQCARPGKSLQRSVNIT